MAKTGHVLMYLLVVLATFAQFELGASQATVQIGLIYFTNNAPNMVMWLTTTIFSDGSSKTDPNFIELPQGQTLVDVTSGTDCVQTLFEMVDPSPSEPGVRFHQVISDWCTTNMPVSCLSDCYWTIDNKGFSVANSATAPPEFVAGWEGPDN